jgi:hypothetical protein
MTPTPTVLLLVALFWTLPASAAVLTYRAHNSSIENVKASLRRSVARAFGRNGLETPVDA